MDYLIGKPTLIKYSADKVNDDKPIIFLNDDKFDIQFVALNPLIGEIICKKGEPSAKVAEYYLVKQDDEIYICSPSFKSESEELIEGVDILKPEHKYLRIAKPEDVLIMVSDIIENLIRRKVPQNQIDIIVDQFLKNCFKKAYIGIHDQNNENFGILYRGIGDASIAPLYDLDLGFNVPMEFNPNIDMKLKTILDSIINTLKSPNFLPNYISTIGKKYTWFDCWVKGFVNNIRDIDLGKILLEEKQIELKPEQISHYMDFIKSQNAIIDQYFLRVSGQR